MTKIVAVTRCLKIGREKIIFHFKGFLGGEKVHQIETRLEERYEVEVGEDYVMILSEISLEDGKLKGKILSFRKLQDMHF